MVYSTSWATIATSLVVIVALVLCWWQVRQVGQAPDDVSGIARLPRLGWMSSVGGFFLVLLAIGSVATSSAPCSSAARPTATWRGSVM